MVNTEETIGWIRALCYLKNMQKHTVIKQIKPKLYMFTAFKRQYETS